MKPGGRPKVFRCDSASELEAAVRNAYHIRAHCPRSDGMKYKIQKSAKAMIVQVSLTE